MKKAHKKDTALEGEMKKTKENLIYLNATFTKEHKSFAEFAAIAMEEVTTARVERDKAQGELAKLHKIAHDLFY